MQTGRPYATWVQEGLSSPDVLSPDADRQIPDGCRWPIMAADARYSIGPITGFVLVFLCFSPASSEDISRYQRLRPASVAFWVST